MLQVFAHPNLSHQLVLVAVHAGQLSNMGKDVLQSIRQLQQKARNEVNYWNWNLSVVNKHNQTKQKFCVYENNTMNNKKVNYQNFS